MESLMFHKTTLVFRAVFSWHFIFITSSCSFVYFLNMFSDQCRWEGVHKNLEVPNTDSPIQHPFLKYIFQAFQQEFQCHVLKTCYYRSYLYKSKKTFHLRWLKSAQCVICLATITMAPTLSGIRHKDKTA